MSTSKEFKEYFKEKKVVSFQHQQEDDKLIDQIFNKSKIKRKKNMVDYI